MLPARMERLWVDARTTAREINERRELLDWSLNARREVANSMANMAAQEQQEQLLLAVSAPGPAGTGLLRSGSASRTGAEVVASPMKFKPGSASTGSLLSMGPANPAKS